MKHINNKERQKEKLLFQTQQKLKQLGLMYEFNRLQFAVFAYSNLNKKRYKKKLFDIQTAAYIVLDFFQTCIIESKKYLNMQELNILYGFSVMQLFEMMNN